MQQKIQELADKIYQEGVQKGEDRAAEIEKAAREKADKELAEAKAKAEQIIADAQKQAEELKRNMEGEIKLSSEQALSVVKQRILDLVTASAVDASTSATFTDPAFIAGLVKTLVDKWDAGSHEAPSLAVLLPEDKQAEVEAAIKRDAAEVMKKGVTIEFSAAVKGGMQISQVESGFKISLTDEDFKAFFKEYLRPRTRAFLFGE